MPDFSGSVTKAFQALFQLILPTFVADQRFVERNAPDLGRVKKPHISQDRAARPVGIDEYGRWRMTVAA
ncbi:MAG: hypothetical protein ACKOCN_11725, partial [Planctomycetaceae bacterium]